MQFAKRKIWINSNRCICELEIDGSVTFAEDASFEELKWAIGALLRDREYERQRRISLVGTEASDLISEMDKKAAINAALEEMTRTNQETGQYDRRPNPLVKKHKCLDCRCQPGCVCCRDGYCGCKQNCIKETP